MNLASKHSLSRSFISATGLSLLIAGSLYVAVQLIHPLDTVANVSSSQWLVVHLLSLVMDTAAIIGLIGIIALLGERLGLVSKLGLGLYGLFWFLTFGFHFAEAFILPAIVGNLPEFVATWQGLVTGESGSANIGHIAAVYGITGISYILGGIIAGIAVAKSHLLPKWSGVLLTTGSALTLLGAIIPHPADRIMAIPVAVALAWIGLTIIKKRD